jgi:hypothetical protein
MSAANSNIQIADLDFTSIKTNFVNYLKQQDNFKDYNFNGSVMSTLLDVLTYNTQYNAYYLNMVANEMFMDTSLQRSSVVSHAKLLNYTPRSTIAPTAAVQVQAVGVTAASLTLPKYAEFICEPISGNTYTFVSTDSMTVDVDNGVATFNNVIIKQGEPVDLTFTYNSSQNPKSMFQLPDTNVDTTSLLVQVYPNPSSTQFDTYVKATTFLSLNGDSEVYFIEEGTDGFYTIRFGDGIIGKQLTNGTVISVSYLISNGTSSAGANSWALTTNIGNFTVNVNPILPASGGLERESIESIKFQATKNYGAQNRAVTKDDYITAIQQNSLGLTFDAISAWGGEENEPPVYGQVFVSLKPSGAFLLTDTQKQRLVQDVLRPISMMTVSPTIVDPDYTYLKLTANVLYDPTKTNLSATQITNLIKSAISLYSTNYLNTFNSTFSTAELITQIQTIDPSIIANEISVQVQKKFYPSLTAPTTYNLYFGAPVQRGLLLSGINSSPSMQFRNPSNLANIIDGVQIEEVPSSTGGVESIAILNPGFGYQSPPTITVLGDGTGATAEAVITTSGAIRAINITNAGNGYTSALVRITPVAGDTTGQLGAGYVTLQGRYGVLRSYYNNDTNVKTIFDNDVGLVDYQEGVVTLESFNPLQVNNDLGQLTISANPTTTIISSTYNRIVTIDPFDPSSIIVNVTPKR